MKTLAYLFVLFFALFNANLAYGIEPQSEEKSPYVLLEAIGNNLFLRIKESNQGERATNAELVEIVEQELVPYIDFNYMALKILNKHLRKLEKAQVKAFSAAIQDHLISTYVKLLAQYNDQQVVFQPGGKSQGKRIVAVKAKIVDPQAPEIDIVFKLRQNKKTKQWLVFDVNAEGISLLDSKRSELSARISQLGFEQVLQQLRSQA
jgi:phospholipid transport system substrate-binding protein